MAKNSKKTIEIAALTFVMTSKVEQSGVKRCILEQKCVKFGKIRIKSRAVPLDSSLRSRMTGGDAQE